MKIAYVTTYDATDVHAWSGSAFHIREALRQAGHAISDIGNLSEGSNFIPKVKQVIYPRLLGKTYLRHREHSLLKHYAAQVETSLKDIEVDVVFSPGSLPIAYLKTDKPVVMWTDATFAGLVDFYPTFSNLSTETIKKGNELEQLALSRCALAIFSSDWAAETALDNYDVDPARVKVVPFGANIVSNRSRQNIAELSDGKDRKVCKLLFVGVDWVRKGGDTALEVARLLNDGGLRTELHVVGCSVPEPVPAHVIEHGFISKTTPEGQHRFDRLMSESHFLILPTKAECAAVVFAEASAFGLPSLATDVGGITTIIADGENGKTFALDADPRAYCDFLVPYMKSPALYRAFAVSSFDRYRRRLNWAAAGTAVSRLLQDLQ